MRSWAAVASSGGPQSGARFPYCESAQQVQAGQAAPQDPLLQQASKSRPSVSGERRCLACGRAFHEIQRLAQHLKDAHQGVNSPDAPAPGAALNSLHPSGGGTAATAAGRPSFRTAVQLGDVLLRAMPLPRSSARAPSRGGGQIQQQQQQQQQQRRPAWQGAREQPRPASRGSAAAATPLVSHTSLQPAAPSAKAGVQAVPEPPPGTRQRKQHKRESRLKRAFRLGSALQACERWQGVLAEVEAALQAVGEAQGCLANQQAAAERQLATAASAARQEGGNQQQEQQGREQEQQGQEQQHQHEQPDSERQLLQANLTVLLQVLRQQQEHAAECRDRLDRAHQSARRQLAAAQERLSPWQRQQKLPVPAEGAETDACTAAVLGEAPGSGPAPEAHRPPAQQDGTGSGAAAPHAELATESGPSEGAASGSQQRQLSWAGAAAAGTDPEHCASVQAVAAQAAGAPGRPQQAQQAVQEGSEPWDAASDASSSLASFAFQDVLSGWAAKSGPLVAKAAKPAVLQVPAAMPARAAAAATAAAPASKGPTAGHSASGVLAGAPAAQPVHNTAPAGPPAEQPGQDVTAAAAARPLAGVAGLMQPAGAGLGAAAGSLLQAKASSTAGSESGSSSGGSGSSDGSFQLQWGDQLLAWAGSVKVEAAAVMQHAVHARPQQAQQVQPVQEQRAQRAAQAPELAQQAQRAQQADSRLARQVEPLLQQPVAQRLSAGLQHQLDQAGLSTEGPPAAVPVADDARQASVAAWLESSVADAVAGATEAAGAGVEPAAAGAGTSPLASAGQSVAGAKQSAGGPSPPGSTVAAFAGTAVPIAPAVLPVADPRVAGWSDEQWNATSLQQQQQLDYVQPAEGVPGAFRCLLCQVTISGQRNLQEHLGSRRHARRVVAQAAAAAQAVTGPEAALALSLAGPGSATAAPAEASSAKAAAGSGGGAARTYTGLGADVGTYVHQVISPELNSVAEAMLCRLLEWQERTRLTDPLNFKRKRRVVSGMREVEKAIKTRKAKVVLLAPNISSTADAECAAGGGDGGSADEAHPAMGAAGSQVAAPGGRSVLSSQCPALGLVALAADREVPLVFALSRQRMGKLMGQRKRASAFAVLDANGVFEELRRLLALAEEGRREWAAHQQAP